jgi:multicomponent Na+:H+ antiporter subunit F
MSIVASICFAMLAIAGALCVWRTVRRSTLPDRTIGVDVASGVIVNGLGVAIALTADPLLVDLALVAGLLGFLTLLTVARYVERRGI